MKYLTTPTVQRRRLAITIALPRLAFLTFCLLTSLTCEVYAQNPPAEWLPNDRGLTPGIPFSEIQTAGGETLAWSQHAHRSGWLWHLYDVKVPLAWKLSTGRPEVVIAAHDAWDTSAVDHPDLPIRRQAADEGQLIVVDANNLGDGTGTSWGSFDGHGLSTLPLAVAAGDNDVNAGGDGRGHIGVAFRCRGLNLTGSMQVLQVDTDLQADGVLRRAAVLNASLGSVQDDDRPQDTRYRASIDSAIVVVSAGCNARNLNNGQCGELRTVPVPSGGTRATWYPGVSYPGAHVYADPAAPDDPSRDYRIISVGATNDGAASPCNDPICGNDAPGQTCDYNRGFMFRGQAAFQSTWNFSPGKDKFNVAADPWTRIVAKRGAFMDLVAPGGFITTMWNNPGLAKDNSGTSQAAPITAGIVGLMLSVDRFAGVELERDQNGDLLNGADVQRRVHALLTMTTDKLRDGCNIYPQWPPCEGQNGSPNFAGATFSGVDGNDEPIQFGYVSQTNDLRRRSWAQRMGFGKVNAYRAVAHTIPLKAAQRFTGSETLPFDNNERGPLGQRIMHMGAWYREGANEDVNNNGQNGEVLDLYEAGGASLPGEIHNNQGVTELNGSNVVLTVPDDATLAIDGIVTTDNPTGGNQLTTAAGGEILIEGMLDNVELMGDTFVGDLIVQSESGTFGCLMAGPDQDNVSEVFGHVEMRDSGAVFVRGWMRMRPGGQITMNGARDIVVRPGGTLEMMYGSRIERNPDTHVDRMIVIDSGATLRVPDGAHVDLFTHVYVRPHGRVQIGEDAAVSLDHFRVEQNGTFEIAAGAHLALRDPDYYSECQGHMIIEGENERMARVTGRFPEIELANPYVECDGVVDHARLVAKGYINNIDASSLQLTSAAFSNVSLQAVNIRIGTVRNCSFTAARSMGMPWQNLVEVNYWAGDDDPVIAPPELNARFEDCEFADEDGGDDPENKIRMDQTYRFAGIFSMNLEALEIDNSSFEHLEDGMRTIDVNFAGLSNNAAEVVDNYIHSSGPISESFECGNTAESVWRCGTYTSTARSQVFDAAYANIHSGIIGTSADRVWMRGSNLDFFVEGVRSVGAAVFLRPDENPGSVNEFGRNVFVVQPLSSIQTEFLENGRSRIDNYMESYGKVILPCGLNNFAAETDLHLDANYLAGAIVTSNRWNNADGNFGVRRGPKVTVFGDDLDESESAMNCGIDEDFQSCPSPPEIGQFSGMNAFGPLMDGNPDSVFIGGIDDLADPTLLPTVRRARAKDSFRAAIKSDSTKKRLDTLRTRIGTVLAADTSVINDTLLRGGLQFLDGVILEKLRRFADARMAFEMVCNSVPTSPDSMLAGWRLRKLDLLELGADHGADYDLAMNAWNDQIRSDLTRYRTPLLLQAKRSTATGPPAGTNTCELTGIAPNPFSAKTSIGLRVFRAQNVRLEIADMQGRVLTVLADREFGVGEHDVECRNNGYASGVYLCRMRTADGHVRTEQLFIR